ncbi:MAG TPA: hypothetical protein VN736_15910 [Candidatus Limnocylindrales bacterium]|nr:hypothetical protein [Candidatus Limnocylindrales bacterium]
MDVLRKFEDLIANGPAGQEWNYFGATLKHLRDILDRAQEK